MNDKQELKVEDLKNIASLKKCDVQKAIVYIESFLVKLMCGKCFPCSLGSYEMKLLLETISNGNAENEKTMQTLTRITTKMFESCLCKKGKDTAMFIQEWTSTEDFKNHSKNICEVKDCKNLIVYEILPERCSACGICKDICRYKAILGEKKKMNIRGYQSFEIIQYRCAKCGECLTVCPTIAIIDKAKNQSF